MVPEYKGLPPSLALRPLMTLVLMRSTGAVTVTAIMPAQKEATKCNGMPSFMRPAFLSVCLVWSYAGAWHAPKTIARCTVCATPTFKRTGVACTGVCVAYAQPTTAAAGASCANYNQQHIICSKYRVQGVLALRSFLSIFSCDWNHGLRNVISTKELHCTMEKKHQMLAASCLLLVM